MNQAELIKALRQVVASASSWAGQRPLLVTLIQSSQLSQDEKASLQRALSCLDNDAENPSLQAIIDAPVSRVIARWEGAHEAETPSAFRIRQEGQLFFILENIRSAHNVGNMLRLADCSSAEQTYLCGYTPTPQNLKVKKTAMGIETAVTWKHRDSAIDAIHEVDRQGVVVMGLESRRGGLNLYQETLPKKCAFLVGNERHGVNPQTLDSCHGALEIPCLGKKSSLNVTQALAIAAYEWLRQYQQKF